MSERSEDRQPLYLRQDDTVSYVVISFCAKATATRTRVIRKRECGVRFLAGVIFFPHADAYLPTWKGEKHHLS
jgi:hypothetical protein